MSPGSSPPVFSALPSFATGSRLISSPCSRQKANQTGHAPRHRPNGPAARRTSLRWRSPASTCKKYAPRHIHKHEGACGHLLYSSATAEHSAVTPSSRKTRGWGGVFILTGSPPLHRLPYLELAKPNSKRIFYTYYVGPSPVVPPF